MIFVIALLTFLLDRITKFAIITNFSQGDILVVIRKFFRITLVFNTGTAFGLLKGANFLFVVLSLAVIIFILLYTHKDRSARLNLAVPLGLIVGGAVGNLLDRVRYGYVIDFIDFRVWPVFNVADSAITIGMIILAWKILFYKPKKV